ncbi:MAG: hypothetical protein QOE28_2168, partial [Solirubrobacteraceae bacterium]|nr:hypothetical protein [Solirubrobacteraceae bacterium]
MRLRRGPSASGVPVVLGTLPLNEAEVPAAAADVAARIQALSLARELRTIAVVPAVGDEPLADTVLALARGLEGEGSPTAVVSVVGDGAGTAARVAELRHDHEYVLLAVPAPGVPLSAVDGALVIAGSVAAASLARVEGVHIIGAVLVDSSAPHQSDPGRPAELEPMTHANDAAAPPPTRPDHGAE